MHCHRCSDRHERSPELRWAQGSSHVGSRLVNPFAYGSGKESSPSPSPITKPFPVASLTIHVWPTFVV